MRTGLCVVSTPPGASTASKIPLASQKDGPATRPWGSSLHRLLVAITLPFGGLPRLAQLALAYRSRHQEQLHPLPELAPCSKPSVDHHCFTASYGFGLAVRAATFLDAAAKGSLISGLIHTCMAHINAPPSVTASRLPAE